MSTPVTLTGTTLANASITATPFPRGAYITDGVPISGTLPVINATSDGSGNFTINLVRSEDMTPDTAWWRIEARAGAIADQTTVEVIGVRMRTDATLDGSSYETGVHDSRARLMLQPTNSHIYDHIEDVVFRGEDLVDAFTHFTTWGELEDLLLTWGDAAAYTWNELRLL